MDGFTKDQWNEVARRYRALDPAARNAASYAARDAAWGAAWDAAWDAAAWCAARNDARGAAGFATWELIGMHTLLNDGKDLLFVPLFDFSKEETKEEPSRSRITFVSTPNGFPASEWIQRFTNSPITHNYYRSTYQE